jgi:predicted nuclease with RNAse H fold
MRYPTFLGIDLTPSEAKPSACIGLDHRPGLAYFGFLAKNKDIVTLASFYSPEVIAIDAPLSLPLGLCCLEETCSRRPKSGGKVRLWDEELRQQGIRCYPTSKKTFIKDLIYRGIELRTSIGREVKQAGRVIEVYPFASKVRLFGRAVPRKTTKDGISFHRAKLADILPGIRPYVHVFDRDLCDAAVAAHTALLYYQNRTRALGSNEEGVIFIPI